MGFLLSAFVFMRMYFDYFVDWLFGLFMNGSKEKVPKIEEPFIIESATSLARKIREGKLKSEDLVRACIKRIEEVNPVINAVANKRFELAKQEAKKIDEDIKNGKYTDEDFAKKPFLGVPFTAKESTACQGLKWTFGLVCRKYVAATEDAACVKSMKNAGAILIGNTNIPQLNLWTESYNPIYGRTNNPYDTSRNVGGSSGGEASIIASCGVPFGLGSDIGGSIRIPSFRCGIFGHKPTSDLINTKGLTYRTGEEGDTMVVAGPMARCSEDLKPMLKVLAGENVKKLNLDKKVDKVRVFYCGDLQDPFVSKPRPEMNNTMTRVVEYLKEKAIDTPKEMAFENMKYSVPLFSFWLIREPGFNFRRDMTDRKGELSVLSVLLNFITLSEEYALYVLYILINLVLPKKKEDFATKVTEDLRNEIIDLLKDDGVLIVPSGPGPANYHYSTYLRPWDHGYTSIFNVLKLPVTQVPTGLSQDGLPLGVQVVAAPHQDHLCLEVARYLEESMGGWVPPCEIAQKEN